MPMFKAGVVFWQMVPEIENALPKIDDVHFKTVDRRAIITSARDGIHSAKSLHYQGRAIDVRSNDLTADQRARLCNELRRALGAGFDVVNEPDHIHIEWDPK
jgi:hypothetical protein